MSELIVGIGEIAVSNHSVETIKTMALGSCVALVMYSPELEAAGLAHVALPDSRIRQGKTRNLPGYFADRAFPYMLAKFKQMGIADPSELLVKLTGGASILDPGGVFNIGARNVHTLRKLIARHKMTLVGTDVGENFSRTVWVETKTGNLYISSPGKGVWSI